MRKILVAPSILSADFNNLEKDIRKIEVGGADYLHFDVMDGHFVDNISFGIPVLKNIAKTTYLIKDVHIMISDPLRYAKRFINAGADILTFHYEACKNDEEIIEIINVIHSNHAKAGLSIKPGTEVNKILKFLPMLDLVLIMSVEPGFGGQKFIDSALEKIKVLREEIDLKQYPTLIEVDGGINQDTGALCVKAGVDVLVAGSYVFNSDNVKERIESLK